MPVQDPFGPTVYTPDLNAPNAGAGWAAGISNLAKGLFPDPNAMAEARYKNLQSQQLQTQAGARSAIADALTGDPNRFTDPNFRTTIFSSMAKLPADEQQQTRANFGLYMQNTNLPQDIKDQFTSGAGITNYPQTPTGVNAQLHNQIQVANIGAGATIGAANIGAAATTTAATTAAAGHVAGVQETQRGETERDDQSLVKVLTSAGPQWMTKADARAGGYTVAPESASDVGTTLSGYGAAGVPLKNPPSHGVSPPAEATQPQTPPSAPEQQSNLGGAITSSISRTNPSNVPKVDPLGTLQELANADLPKTDIRGTNYTVGVRMQQSILSRANQYMNDKTGPEYNNEKAAIARAYNEIVTPIKNTPSLVYEGHHAPFDRQPPTVDFAPNYAPPPMPTSRAQPPPGTTPLPPGGGVTMPATTPPPAAPRPTTAPPRPATTAAPKPVTTPKRNMSVTEKPPTAAPRGGGGGDLSVVPTEKRQPGLVFGNQVYTGQGANAKDPKSWRPATAAEVTAAKQSGNYYQ